MALQPRYTLTMALSENLKAETWYERLNLFGKIKKFCQFWTGTFIFWAAVGICTLLEPILCSNKPVGAIYTAQIVVLYISSALYIIQLIGVASREWDKIVMIQALSASSTSLIMPVTNFTPLKIFIFFTAEGEYILEFCCLLGGWLTIFVYPGLAVLRCFRVFRLLWFYEVEVFKSSTEYALNPILGPKFVSRLFKVLKFAIKALSALGNEMFRLTNATRGGLLLMMVFFYSAFVLGTSLWIETDGTNEACMSFQQCSYTLMRLTFYDGTGFDFAYSLTSSHRFLFFLVIVYMCLTSFGILNGLVGIFGTAFAVASDDAFNDSENEEEEEEAGDDENNDGDEGGSGKVGAFSSGKDLGFGNSGRGGGLGGGQGRGGDEDGSDGDDEGGSGAAPPMPVFQRGVSRKRLEAKQMENKLKGALGGKSNFALKELQKMANAEVAAARAPRRTLRDVVQQHNIVKSGAGDKPAAHPMFSALRAFKDGSEKKYTVPAENVASPGESPEKERMRQPVNMFAQPKKANKNLHAAVGMFSALKNQKSAKHLTSGQSATAGHSASASASGGHGHSHGASGGANPFREYMAAAAAAASQGAAGHGSPMVPGASAADVKAMSASIHTLQKTVDSQNEMILSMFQQIQALNKNLRIIHPDLPEPPTPLVPLKIETTAATASAPTARRHSNFMGFMNSTKSPDEHVTSPAGGAESHNSSAHSLPAVEGPRKNSLFSHLHFPHATKATTSAAAAAPTLVVEHDAEHVATETPALSAVEHAEAAQPAAAKNRREKLAELMHASHHNVKEQPAAAHDSPLEPAGESAENLTLLSQEPAAPAASVSLAAVHPMPASVEEAPAQQSPRSSHAQEAAMAKAAESRVFTAPKGSSKNDSVDSFGSIEVIDAQEDISSTLLPQTPQSAPLSVSKPGSHSRPRKSPVPQPHIRSRGSAQSSVLGVMGRITTPKSNIFDETGDAGLRESPEPPHQMELPPVSTTMAVKPQGGEEHQARPQTRKSSDPPAPTRTAKDVDLFSVSERAEPLYEGGEDDVREINPEQSLSDLGV